jgi:hypothetical protein
MNVTGRYDECIGLAAPIATIQPLDSGPQAGSKPRLRTFRSRVGADVCVVRTWKVSGEIRSFSAPSALLQKETVSGSEPTREMNLVDPLAKFLHIFVMSAISKSYFRIRH